MHGPLNLEVFPSLTRCVMSLFLRRMLATTVVALGMVPGVAGRLAAQSGVITGKVTDATTARARRAWGTLRGDEACDV